MFLGLINILCFATKYIIVDLPKQPKQKYQVLGRFTLSHKFSHLNFFQIPLKSLSKNSASFFIPPKSRPFESA